MKNSHFLRHDPNRYGHSGESQWTIIKCTVSNHDSGLRFYSEYSINRGTIQIVVTVLSGAKLSFQSLGKTIQYLESKTEDPDGQKCKQEQ
jgi:hypothetical protein